jgi:hypothetical protein
MFILIGILIGVFAVLIGWCLYELYQWIKKYYFLKILRKNFNRAWFVEDDILARGSLKGKYSPSDTCRGGVDSSKTNPPSPSLIKSRRKNGSNNNRDQRKQDQSNSRR